MVFRTLAPIGPPNQGCFLESKLVASLEALVQSAAKTKAEYQEALGEFRETLDINIGQIEKDIQKDEKNAVQTIQTGLTPRAVVKKFFFEQAKSELVALKKAIAETQQLQNEDFQKLQDLFETQLRLKAPAQLWAQRAEEHKKGGRLWKGLCCSDRCRHRNRSLVTILFWGLHRR